jgi:quercetin dioxygenase-like cupin family protein
LPLNEAEKKCMECHDLDNSPDFHVHGAFGWEEAFEHYWEQVEHSDRPRRPRRSGLVHINPNQSNPLHLHPNSAEYLHVLSGSCEHRLDDQWVTLKAGDTLRIPRGAVHLARTRDEACRVMVVFNTGKRQMVVVEEPKSD